MNRRPIKRMRMDGWLVCRYFAKGEMTVAIVEEGFLSFGDAKYYANAVKDSAPTWMERAYKPATAVEGDA